MYKTQMKLQKILCLLAILASALVFIYSLGLMTDLYDSLYGTMTDPNDLTKTTVPGSIVYYDMQGFNNTFMKAGLGLILLSCLLSGFYGLSFSFSNIQLARNGGAGFS